VVEYNGGVIPSAAVIFLAPQVTGVQFSNQQLERENMFNVLVKFLILFIPTCLLGIGGFALALKQAGIFCVIGWIMGVFLGFLAVLQILVLINGLIGINRWHKNALERLDEVQERDAKLFAEGKSFDEVIAQYKQPKNK
jgi:cytochrome b subunit of formate dehydrogenase